MDQPRAFAYVMFILLTVAPSHHVFAQLTLYPTPANAVTSDVFSLSIDGTPVPVMKYKDYHYAHFGFEGAIKVTVTVGETITSRQIRPNSLGVASQVTGGVNLSFKLTQAPDTNSTPSYTVLQINDLEKLVLLGDPLETNVPAPKGKGVFNVLDYGADATGATYTQPAFQSAIDVASEFGTPTNPGIVYVPSGVYQVRENLRLKDNVDFYLAPGSVLKADTDVGNYSVSNNTIGPVLQVKDASNVMIRGRGEVDASGVELMGLFSVRAPVFLEQSQAHPRRRIIQTDNARNLKMEGIIAKDATGWSIDAVRSDGVVVQNTKVLNHKDINWKIQNDGINMTSSSKALVNQSFVITIDDAMCSKARHSEVGSMDNVEFSNNVLWTWSAGVKTGMQNDHPMNHVVFRNIDVVHARRAIAMDTKTSREIGQSIPTEGVLFRDIRVDELNGHWSISNHDAVEFLLEDAPVNNVVIENLSLPEKRPIRTGPNFAANNVAFYNLRMGGELILNKSQISLAGKQPINELSFAAEAPRHSINTGSQFPGAGDPRVIAASPNVASPFGNKDHGTDNAFQAE